MLETSLVQKHVFDEMFVDLGISFEESHEHLLFFVYPDELENEEEHRDHINWVEEFIKYFSKKTNKSRFEIVEILAEYFAQNSTKNIVEDSPELLGYESQLHFEVCRRNFKNACSELIRNKSGFKVVN
jgi:hypothetical protein